MHIALHIMFWSSLVGLVYIYAGYPVLIWLLARCFSRQKKPCKFVKPFSIVVIACNEEQNILRKLHSIFASDAEAQICEVLVASDGSTDKTAEIVRNYPNSKVTLHHFSERRGKPAVLNDVLPLCEADIVVLMDARQELAADALGCLVANFADEHVGVVSGELVFRAHASSTVAAEGIGVYWKYEKFIRRCESMLASVPGATGAFYAIRQELFQPIPEQTLLDDVQIPMQAVMQGRRCLFESTAVVYDTPSKSTSQESIRKRRTIAGVVQLLLLNPSWLLPWKNPIWVQYVSHKILRLVSPLLLVTTAVSNVLLLEHPVYRLLGALQIFFYVAAVAGWLLQKLGKRSRWLGPALLFMSLNITTIFALWDALRGRFRVTWQRSN